MLYVSATRGRESNKMYVDTTYDPDPATGHDTCDLTTEPREVLAGVLANEGADLSAHETLEIAQRRVEDFAVLAAEYETLAAAAQEQRWTSSRSAQVSVLFNSNRYARARHGHASCCA